MESLANGLDYPPKTWNSTPVKGSNVPLKCGAPRTPRPTSPAQRNSEGPSSTSHHNGSVKVIHHPNGSVSYQKKSQKPVHDHRGSEELLNMEKHICRSSKEKSESPAKSGQNSIHKEFPVSEKKSIMKHPAENRKNYNSAGLFVSENTIPMDPTAPCPCKGISEQLKKSLTPQSDISFYPSPSTSLYPGTTYAEAKQSFSNTEVTEFASSVEKFRGSGEVSCDLVESRKNSIYRGSTCSDLSDESATTINSGMYKPHKANDVRWEAIQAVRAKVGALEFKNFRLLKDLGCGDIGKVHLSELVGTRCYFAMKVMDKALLASRKKLLRAQTEREILQSLDHPFLPTLYTHFETEMHSCLVMEYCPGGDLHALRQKQPGKYFPEHAARFYVAEVLLALEYLHMLGIIYRDLKPENVLVREDGHIMLSDFDLSLRCAVSPTLVKSTNTTLEPRNPACIGPSCVVQPDCIRPACFGPSFFPRKPKKEKKSKVKNETNHQVSPLPELMAEPTNARSMSFVGTHEYLAPEIIKGEGHGSAVDWWTFGIFLYELLFGKTPFKGSGNRATLFNVVGQPLRFPEYPTVSFAAKDLIKGLLIKEPQHRLAYRRGATEVKQHPFFQSINWALIRCTSPPDIPRHVMDFGAKTDTPKTLATDKAPAIDFKPSVKASPKGS